MGKFREPGLYRALREYSESDMYPFHMPGHKRRTEAAPAAGFPNPFAIDITEIEGFDNLHHPEGILRESMEWAAEVYGSDRTYYLVNGSTGGVLAAVCAAGPAGPSFAKRRLLMARNSHKSAYHAVELLGIEAGYVYPRILAGTGLQGGILPEEIEEMLTDGDFAAVFVTSPTYDGVVSDIRGIAEVCHRHRLPLIVDEAHGAHFPFGKEFPVPALELGADVAVQSLHKTLPSFTQTAVLHARGDRVDPEKLEYYLQIFQSSSPSYVFLAGIERCIRYMDGPGREKMTEFAGRLKRLRKNLSGMRRLRLIGGEVIGRAGVFDLDLSKIIISTGGTGLSGKALADILRNRYRLEPEMYGTDSVTAITTLTDTEEGLNRLEQALLETDDMQGKEREAADGDEQTGGGRGPVPEGGVEPQGGMSFFCPPQAARTIRDGLNSPARRVKLEESVGCVSAEYVCLYPPGIPIVAPGEVLSAGIVRQICGYRERGLPVQGLRDYKAETIFVVS